MTGTYEGPQGTYPGLWVSEGMNFVTWVGITPPLLITSVAPGKYLSHLVPEFIHLKTGRLYTRFLRLL